jgi:hypothetical protein
MPTLRHQTDLYLSLLPFSNNKPSDSAGLSCGSKTSTTISAHLRNLANIQGRKGALQAQKSDELRLGRCEHRDRFQVRRRSGREPRKAVVVEESVRGPAILNIPERWVPCRCICHPFKVVRIVRASEVASREPLKLRRGTAIP